MIKICKVVGVTLPCLLAMSASANTFTFDTGVISIGGQTSDAEAVVTTGAGVLNITLRNLEADPISVIQCISGLGITLSGGQTTGSLTSSSGLARTVNSGGSFTDGSAVPTGWMLTGSLPGISLDVLGTTTGPAHLVIGGPGTGGTYDLAKGSIAGNGPHNAFLAGDVTFSINVNGLTSNDKVSSVLFQFGTTAGTNYTATIPDAGTTVSLLGTALLGLGLIRRRLS